MMFGFITKREHDEIVANQEAISDRLHAELWAQDHIIAERNREVADLRARLAKFERERDPKTKRFVSLRPTVRAGGMGEVVDA